MPPEDAAHPPPANPARQPGDGEADAPSIFRPRQRTGPRRTVRAEPAVPPTPPPDPAPHLSEHDVQIMLRANVERQEAAKARRREESGVDFLPPPRPSKRRRDYILLLVLGNLCFAGFTAVGPNIVTLAFALGGAVVFTAGLTWVMYFVMDDY